MKWIVLYCTREPRIIPIVYYLTVNMEVYIRESQNDTLECFNSKLVLS